MALTKKMKPNEMVDFIDKELIPQVELEIGNWIHPRKRKGGYFVVIRQIMCMVDFLGAVYSGYSLPERRKDFRDRKERIATTKKAKKYIARFFEPKQTYNKEAIDNLYDIYRHGLVHLYQPRILKYRRNAVLQWFIYRGKRFYKKLSIDTPRGKKVFNNVGYLQVLEDTSNKNYYYFPIGIDCLYEDFLNSVNKYKESLLNIKSLQIKWRTAVKAICTPI